MPAPAAALAVSRPRASSTAKIRALGEQAMATINSWRLRRKPRCRTNRITEADRVQALPPAPWRAIVSAPLPLAEDN
ncbi:hypothetical protein CA983_06155 [Streptomyces swartbergensis]|uniref:Transposase n=1 Tax=Streptomyces swartbergensis TaxID=487165 RepID=A0A243S8L2_9ACTN|nr:hypothetical protein CA983_06155 [Streptomyces swartbergensis]